MKQSQRRRIEGYCNKEHYTTCSANEHPQANVNPRTLGSACINQKWSFERTAYDVDMMKKFNQC